MARNNAFDLAFNSMRDLVLIKGPNSRILWANSAFLDYYGMTLGELEDLVDGPQSDPDDTLQYVRDDAMVFQVGDHVDIPSEAVTGHDGKTRLFHTIKSPISVDGDVVMSVGVSRRHDDADIHISPSHQDAKSLAKPLRLLTTAFPLAMVLVDVRGRIVSASPQWNEQFGSVSSGSEAFFVDAYPELAAIAPDLTSAVGGGEAGVHRLTVKRVGSGGERRELEIRLGPWRYEDGTSGGAMVLALDVTEAASQAERLREANQRFDLVIAGSSAGIWDWLDVNGQEEYWSPRFHQLLGYEPGELEPTLDNFNQLIHPDDRTRVLALVEEHLSADVPFDVNYRLLTKSGQYRWYRGTGLAARGSGDKPTRMVGSIQDIHERIEGQQAITRMNEDLEHFAHLAAHDLREPARRQRMLVSLAMEDHGQEMSPELRQSLEAVRNQSDAMLSMIDGFRALTGFAGPGLELAPIDLQAMTEELVREMGADHEPAEVTFDLPCHIVGYPILVELLFRNLISNAFRHGTSPLRLTFGHRRDGGRTIIVVSSSWDGDAETVNDRLLRPFVTGRDPAGRETIGSGLGLTICRRVVEHHRGRIAVRPQHGSFTIEFNLGES